MKRCHLALSLALGALVLVPMAAREPLASRIVHSDPAKYRHSPAVRGGAGSLDFTALFDSHVVDGLPRVPASWLESAKGMSSEEAIVPAGRGGGPPNISGCTQFDGKFKVLHPEPKMAGRVVTAMYMPTRADIDSATGASGAGVNLAAPLLFDHMSGVDVSGVGTGINFSPALRFRT
jgi:hypothetical protein